LRHPAVEANAQAGNERLQAVLLGCLIVAVVHGQHPQAGPRGRIVQADLQRPRAEIELLGGVPGTVGGEEQVGIGAVRVGEHQE